MSGIVPRYKTTRRSLFLPTVVRDIAAKLLVSSCRVMGLDLNGDRNPDSGPLAGV